MGVNKRQFKKNSVLANVVSRVFDPVVEIPLAVSFAAWFAVSNDLRWRFLVLLLLIDGFLPFVFFLHLIHKKEVSGWDIRERKERYPLYIFTLVAHLVGVILAFVLEKYALFVILSSFYLVALLFMVVTFFWKISIHGGVNSVLVTFLNILLGWKWWFLYGIVFLVGWARVRNGHHSVSQYVMGSLLGGGVFYIGFVLLSRIFL